MWEQSTGRIQQLGKLPINTRNRLRGILALDVEDSIGLLDKLRAEKSVQELVQIEKVLRLHPLRRTAILPDIFPRVPPTSEAYHRLESLPYAKELRLIEALSKEHMTEVLRLCEQVNALNAAILSGNPKYASEQIASMRNTSGYSHLLIRKAVLLRSKSDDPEYFLPETEDVLIESGLEQNNIFLSSLIHCFKEEQDYLSLKRSILNLPKHGKGNRYTRDICRLAFHPFARDHEDFGELLQSCRQASLIDAILIAKVNSFWWTEMARSLPALSSVIDYIDRTVVSVDTIATSYCTDDSEGEYTFYKQSGAWLENNAVANYRLLADHFYDAPNGDYSTTPPLVLSLIDQWTNTIDLDQLAECQDLTSHNNSALKSLESSGSVTRSALFNYIINQTQGYARISEDHLFSLMGQTRDLAKTSSPSYLSNLAKVADTKRSRLILYFLIARRSKNELDDHTLRRILQEIVKREHGGSLVSMLEDLRTRSTAVAEYAYEVCTEDFIAKLYKIILTASEITETRAALHKWMGRVTGEKTFLDRARTLLIDHQLNKIRNELDDNRIYVDSARFAEWMNDEVMRDLNGVLTGSMHKMSGYDPVDPQLAEIIERCFSSFCSNKIFGIASYLGRRIRHGTFKGHLYSSVVSIERLAKYKDLVSEQQFSALWQEWKKRYEAKIDEIIRTRLHIETTEKRDGLLKPTIHGQAKQGVLAACARNLLRDFADTNSTLGSIPIVTEFCWRLAELDLKAINSFLKSQKNSLLDIERLNELKLSANYGRASLARDFHRDLTHSINSKLIAMYNWFKKPVNVAPKASLSLLYKAVVAEVKTSFPEFETDTEFDEQGDIELIGGAYHVIYDSMYVIVYNASKHGKPGASIQRDFEVMTGLYDKRKILRMTFTSAIKDSETNDSVNERLKLAPDDDLNDAQVSEDRSGIRKLHNLALCNPSFFIGNISCRDRNVNIELYYALEH